MRLLQERFDEAPEGEERLLTIKGAGSRRRQVVAIIKRAGVEPWDLTWQTLRRSCEIEWAQRLPQYAVSRWIGHSISVSGRHYANSIRDELFHRVAGREAAQHVAQHSAEIRRADSHGAGTESARTCSKSYKSGTLRDNATTRDESDEWSRGESNPRPETVSTAPLRV